MNNAQCRCAGLRQTCCTDSVLRPVCSADTDGVLHPVQHPVICTYVQCIWTKGEGLMQLYTVQCSGRYTVRTRLYSAHVVCVAQMCSSQADEPQHTKPHGCRVPGSRAPDRRAAGPWVSSRGLEASGVPTSQAKSMLSTLTMRPQGEYAHRTSRECALGDN
jgi:hypothetical protein